MTRLGSVRVIRRHPVKSMAGEIVARAIVSYAGVVGDRVYAFTDRDALPHFPWFTARVWQRFMLYRPRFADPAATLSAEGTQAAWARGSIVALALPDDTAFALAVTTPDGEVLPIDDPRLLASLEQASGRRLALRFATRGMQDCRPLSLVSRQTLEGFADELGRDLDARRYRMNVEFDWLGGQPFAETELIGRRLRIGGRVEIAVVESDPRCAMITIDPETGDADRGILRHLADRHDGNLGIYAAVHREGVIAPGDSVVLLD